LFDATEQVRKALSAILRTGEWFGAGHLIDILTGSATAKVRERGHDQLPTFAVGKDLSKPAWGAVFRQMMGRDLVRPDPDRHGALRMTDAARPILRGEASVTLRRDTVVAAEREPARTQVADEDAGLLSLLKARRRALAEAQNVPAYVVFPDRTLIEMAEKRPATLDQMAGITGVGAKKLDSYGAAFLEVITGEGARLHPARMRLVGKPEGALFDRLAEAQLALSRGEDGTGKYLGCTHSTLRLIAERRPSTLAELQAIQGMGELKVERFGAAFLDILRDT
jgi:ATP-dependent DNA helicase RecQ